MPREPDRTQGGRRVGLALAFVLASWAGTGQPQQAGQADWERYRQTLESVISTAGETLAAPLAAAADGIGAAPAALRTALTLKCNRNLQDVATELQDGNLSAARRAQLEARLERNQAVLSALNGDPQPLRELADRQRPASPSERMRGDERSFMEGMLTSYGTRVDDRVRQGDLAASAFRTASAAASAASADARRALGLAGASRYVFEGLETDAPEACLEAQEHDSRARAFAVAAHDGERALADRLALARRRAEACVTTADANAVRTAYEQARQLGARMEKDLGQAVQELASAEQAFAHHEAILTAWRQTAGDRSGSSPGELRERFSTGRDALAKRIEAMEQAARELRGATDEMRSLAGQIAQSKAEYVKAIPEAVARWTALEKRAVLSPGDQGTLSLSADELRARKGELQQLLEDAWIVERLEALALQPCARSDEAQRAIKALSAARDAALLALAADERLLGVADQCARRAAGPRPGATPAPASPAGAPPAATPAPPAATTPSTPAAASAGGLRIGGPTSVTSGEGAVYTATDGAGHPYTAGVTWLSSVEDVLVMGAGGQAVGFKAGSSVVVAHKDDMTAFLQVEVKARPDSPGGGPGDAPFSTSGGEPGPAASGSSDDDCRTLRETFEAALSAGDQAWARTVLDRSSHCGFHAGALAQFEERRTQAQAQQDENRRAQCVDLLGQVDGALGAGDQRRAEAILSSAQDCPFYAQGLQATRDAAQEQSCESLRQAYAGAMQIGQLARANWAVEAARSQGCSVPESDGAALAQALEAERTNRQQAEQERIQRQMDAMQGFIQGLGTVMQNQRRPPPGAGAGPARPPAAPPARPPTSTARPPAGTPSPTRQNCRDVCVKERTVWYASDGRHQTCCPGGVPNPRCLNVTCARGTQCDRWEKRCTP